MKTKLFQVRTGLVFLSFASLLTGCGTMPGGDTWGDHATLVPGWDRLGRAAYSAAASPHTWAPLAGAAALQIGNIDQSLGEWAVNNQPIFGDKDGAIQASDDLSQALEYWMYATMLATPSGAAPAGWAASKAKGIGVEWVASDATRIITRNIKKGVARGRPDGSNDHSFPSGHTSMAFSRATLASRNIRAMSLPNPVEYSLQGATDIAAVGTGWARLEAGVHYPSDVLAGAALGYFLSAFLHDAFLGESEDGVMLQVVPAEDQVEVQASWRF
ncbi:MAG: phosphatase PAP2 family protein [Kiritimatiellae bacterium]|nr:phosphatase PAP2 family protein [Kiritimatiellia bacterium]